MYCILISGLFYLQMGSAIVRPWVHSRDGIRAVEWLQAACGVRTVTDKNWHFYALFRAFSTLGEEIFSLMPLLFWFGWPTVSLPFATNFAGVILLGQYLKDVYKLPRPAVYPKTNIIRLETHFETEYGFPSTHSTSGLMPLVVLLALQRHHPALHALLPSWIYPSIYFLAILVGLSRLYMGVHSIADVVGGLGIGTAGVLCLHRVGDHLDDFMYHSRAGIVIPLISLIWFCCFYPKGRPWSAAWGTASQIFGTWFGVATSANVILTVPSLQWIATRLSLNSSRPASEWRLGKIMYELAVGVVVAGLSRVISKALTQGVALALVERGIVQPHKDEERDTLGRPVPKTKLYCVEVPTRLASYSFLAFSVVILTPAAWVALGI